MAKHERKNIKKIKKKCNVYFLHGSYLALYVLETL